MQMIQYQFLENGRQIWLMVLQRQDSCNKNLPQAIVMVQCQSFIPFIGISVVKI